MSTTTSGHVSCHPKPRISDPSDDLVYRLHNALTDKPLENDFTSKSGSIMVRSDSVVTESGIQEEVSEFGPFGGERVSEVEMAMNMSIGSLQANDSGYERSGLGIDLGIGKSEVKVGADQGVERVSEEVAATGAVAKNAVIEESNEAVTTLN